MEKDLVILGISIREYLPYFFILILGIFVGILFVLRTIKEVSIDTKAKMIQYVIYGVGSSMLTTWIAYEVLNYYTNFPLSLSSALAGGVGFIGAETASRLVISFFEKKFGTKKD
ncbi:phage holin family protein [Helicobacter sp. 13S00477-4]|uniref:phage holin family protein n=1 Tax=Helicobacter sp. 13S00477-4 TaxID=1905759 RepID=UPI000BA55BCA|nr:phage holin family protein [Helicobacter sp. 13S00477-4]PAF51283.1 holin [Helicobacter sp. 13S00477-4]